MQDYQTAVHGAGSFDQGKRFQVNGISNKLFDILRKNHMQMPHQVCGVKELTICKENHIIWSTVRNNMLILLIVTITLKIFKYWNCLKVCTIFVSKYKE